MKDKQFSFTNQTHTQFSKMITALHKKLVWIIRLMEIIQMEIQQMH